MTRHSVTLQAGALTAVIGDNAADGNHRAGYNGMWSLSHRDQPDNLFVPFYSGFNLEHIFTLGTTSDHENLFEPRHAPMHLNVLGDGAELHQPPTPTTQVESWTRFRLVEPDMIEFAFRCVTHLAGHDYLGLFWASYIHAPQDKSMYFRGGPTAERTPTIWQQLCTQLHGCDATVSKRGSALDRSQPPKLKGSLFNSVSSLGWDEPLFYGRLGEMALLVLFDNDERIRLTHSPSGGGLATAPQTTNPAWDFQWVIPNPRGGEEYSFRARIIYRFNLSREDLRREASRFADRRSNDHRLT